MESIPLPTHIAITNDADSECKATLAIEPLYPGYGPTVGNALRRVMLNSIPGGAFYAFKVKGVSHEFTSINFVKEDVVDISLNLKQVDLRVHTDEPVELKLNITGEKVVCAGDIEPNADVEIVNPEQVIMTLTDKAATLEMTLWAKQGRGYEPVEQRENEELEVNAIAIDSIFTPVREVGYEVDNIRVGNRTDYDKVVMRIVTNGAVTVAEAIAEASEILADHFKEILQNVTAAPKHAGESAQEEEAEPKNEEAEDEAEHIKEEKEENAEDSKK